MARPSLAGRTALITGAVRRVGRSIALALAREGVNLILHYHRTPEDADSLARELDRLGVRHWTLEADFEADAGPSGLVEDARTLAGDFNILVNNASIFPEDTLATVTLASLIRNLQVNAWAPLVLSRDFAGLAHTAAVPGQIVNLLDTRIESYDFKHVAYILSKHMLAVLTRMAAMAYAPHVLVNGVAPGLILPPAGRDEDYLQRLAATTPLNRHGEPEDVAQAVLYFLKNDYVTGEIIHLDGGRHLRG